MGQKDLMKLLVDPVLAASGSGIHKQGKASIAKCVAALVVTQNPAEAQAVVSLLLLFKDLRIFKLAVRLPDERSF